MYFFFLIETNQNFTLARGFYQDLRTLIPSKWKELITLTHGTFVAPVTGSTRIIAEVKEDERNDTKFEVKMQELFILRYVKTKCEHNLTACA